MNKEVTVKLLNKDSLLRYTGTDVVKKEDLEKQLNATFMANGFLNLGAIIVRRSEVEWITICDEQLIIY